MNLVKFENLRIFLFLSCSLEFRDLFKELLGMNFQTTSEVELENSALKIFLYKRESSFVV